MCIKDTNNNNYKNFFFIFYFYNNLREKLDRNVFAKQKKCNLFPIRKFC